MSTDVSGQITVSSPRSVKRSELLAILETTLSGQGIVMAKTSSGYRITPSQIGAGAVDRGMATQPGYGVSVVPLRHVSASVMMRLLSGFVSDAEGVRMETGSNSVIVRGPSAKRDDAVQTIVAFDADWMKGQSVSIFEVRRARPETVVAELSQIFDSGENGASAGLIQFKPISRLRAILAVSKNPALVKRAESFVRRLDGESESAAENVFVYQARYRDARELAKIISNMFMARTDGRNEQATGSGPQSSGALLQPPSSNSFGGRSSFASGGSNTPTLPQTNAGPDFAAAFGDKPSDQSTEPKLSSTAPDVIDLTRQNGSSGNSRVAVSADVSNNSVVVYSDGETYQKIQAALRRLDSNPLQVAVNVTIAEVQLTDQLRFGIQYFVGSGRAGLGKDNGSLSLFSQAANVLSKQVPGLNFLVGSDSSLILSFQL
jgi:general secretion pathway protein D